MLNQYKPIRYFALFLLFIVGLFTWATMTGSRFLGDDNESVENRGGYGSGNSRGGRGVRHGFYHK